MDPSGHWGVIGESRKRTLKVWISKMQNAQKRQQPKSSRIGRAACFPRIAPISYKMTLRINKGIPYKMNGPNPAKFSNCILRLLYDSDFMRKSSIFLRLQYGNVQGGPYKMASEMGLEPLQITTCYKMAFTIWAWRPGKLKRAAYIFMDWLTCRLVDMLV